jgi:hypothetical protein
MHIVSWLHANKCFTRRTLLDEKRSVPGLLLRGAKRLVEA